MEKINANNLTALALTSFAGASSTKASSGTNFQSYLDKADSAKASKANNSKSDTKVKDDDKKTKTNAAKSDKSDDVQTKKSDTSKTDTSKNKNDEVKDDKTNEATEKSDSKKTDRVDKADKTDKETKTDKEIKTEDVQKIDNVSKVSDKLTDKEKEVIEEISDITGLSEEQITDALSQMGISPLQLSDKGELVKFMQKAFDVESPAELLNVDGAKEMMEQITDTVSEALEELDMNLDDINALFENSVETKAVEKNIDNVKELVKGEQNVQNDTQFVETNEPVDVVVEVQNGAFNGANSENFSQGEKGFSNNSFLEEQNVNIGGVVTDNIAKALNEVATRTESTRNVDSSEIIRQIVEKIKLEGTQERINEMKITLKPDYLGEVSLKIAVDNGIVTAHFTAESQRVKEIIESNFEQFKQTLSEQGIEVGQLEVNVGNSGENDESSFARQAFGERNVSSGRVDALKIPDEDESQGYVSEEEVVEANVSYMA
jgi:flagellar hook-length control protein FliK